MCFETPEVQRRCGGCLGPTKGGGSFETQSVRSETPPPNLMHDLREMRRQGGTNRDRRESTANYTCYIHSAQVHRCFAVRGKKARFLAAKLPQNINAYIPQNNKKSRLYPADYYILREMGVGCSFGPLTRPYPPCKVAKSPIPPLWSGPLPPRPARRVNGKL